MGFPKYPEYKDSGVDWLGSIPAKWHIKPLWTKYRRTKRTGYADEELLSVYRDYGVLPKSSRDDNFNKPSDDLSAYQLVEEGDLAINKMKAWQGSVAVSDYRGIVSPAYFVLSSTHEDNNRYMHYLLRSPRYITGYMCNSKGIRVNQWDLEPIQHRVMPVVCPPVEEQQVIATFLDRETAKIDALVSEQRRLIELLKEKRQAVISHAVTKGLNPNAPMKPSNIPWLGDVPEHWEVKQLKWMSTLHRGYDLTSDEAEAGPYPVVTSGGITGSHTTAMAKGPGVVTGRYGSTGNWFFIEDDFWPHNTSLYVSNFHGNIERYIWYALQGVDVKSLSAKSAVPGIDRNDVHEIYVAVPPSDEQTEIAKTLDHKCKATDQLLDQVDSTIDLLQERRTALISAAVTGKIDVRNAIPEAKSIFKPKPYTQGFARQLLAGEILYRFHKHPTMGRVKLQKLLHLCEYHGQLDEVKASYRREAAGPFDNKMMIGVASGLKKQKWFESVRKDGRTVYAPMEKAGQHQKYLSRWQTQIPRIEEILTLLGQAKTQQCEIVSTLYAAWNDLLIEGKSPSDAEIIREASDPVRWHKNKAKIPSEKWASAISWMREKDIVPQGFGVHTKQGKV